MRFIFLTVLAALMLVRTASAQIPRVGVVEHYGVRKLSLDQVNRAVGIAAGDSLSENGLAAAMKSAQARLSSLPGVEAAAVEAVCCLDNELMIFAGLREAGVPGPRFLPAPHGTARLPEEIVRTSAPFDSLLGVAVINGDAAEDDAQGHALSHAPALRAIQNQYLEFAREYLDTLRVVLHTAADPRERAVAAQVIAYAPDKRAVVGDLVAATHDPDDGVRNNAVRALAVIAVLAEREPARGIVVPAAPFVDLLSSVMWSDLNKSALALDRITSAARDPALMAALRPRALAVLADMARWRSAGHARPAFNILGRVAGLQEQAIAEAWDKSGREKVIAAAWSAQAEPAPGVVHGRANGKLVSVPVRVQGSHVLWFVLDTGAPRTIVDSTAAHALGLQIVSQERGTGAGRGTFLQQHASPIDVSLGAMVLHVPEPWVIDLANVGTQQRADGLLGEDLFEHYVVRIDPELQTLTLSDSASFRFRGAGTMLPLTKTKNRLYVDVKLTLPNGIHATHAMRIDTGSEDAASDDLVRQSTERRVARQGVGLGTAYVDTSGLFESVELGPYAVHRAWGASNDHPALGMEILRRFTMTFDVPHGRLFLEPNSHFKDPVPAPTP